MVKFVFYSSHQNRIFSLQETFAICFFFFCNSAVIFLWLISWVIHRSITSLPLFYLLLCVYKKTISSPLSFDIAYHPLCDVTVKWYRMSFDIFLSPLCHLGSDRSFGQYSGLIPVLCLLDFLLNSFLLSDSHHTIPSLSSLLLSSLFTEIRSVTHCSRFSSALKNYSADACSRLGGHSQMTDRTSVLDCEFVNGAAFYRDGQQ